MPQLDFFLFYQNIYLMAIVFILLYFYIFTFFFPKVIFFLKLSFKFISLLERRVILFGKKDIFLFSWEREVLFLEEKKRPFLMIYDDL